ncbi:MAG: hypothetical protein AAGI71_09180 [Bacteroidota bacterium]
MPPLSPRPAFLCGLLAICSLLILAACGRAAPLLDASSIDAGTLHVDGDAAEWVGHLRSVDGAPLALGVAEDDEALYISILTTDADAVRHTLLTGLVIWVDVDGGQKKNYGIHFPLGAWGGGRASDPNDRRLRDASDADPAGWLQAMLGRLALLQEEVRTVHDRDSLPGLEVDGRLVAGTLTLELKVPLQGAAYALDASQTSIWGIGLETPEIDREAVRAQLQARRGPRSGGGVRRGGGRGQGVRGGAGRPSPPEPVEAWVRVARR